MFYTSTSHINKCTVREEVPMIVPVNSTYVTLRLIYSDFPSFHFQNDFQNDFHYLTKTCNKVVYVQ